MILRSTLILALLFGCASCGDDATPAGDTTTTDATDTGDDTTDTTDTGDDTTDTGDDTTDTTDTGDDTTDTSDDTTDTGDDTTDTGDAKCVEDPPLCMAGCGSDWIKGDAECVDGAWVCPPDSIATTDCPEDTCWGLPLPGEICGDNGWECQPDAEDWAACPSLMCAVCEGFDGAQIQGACSCACDKDNQVSCVEIPPPAKCGTTIDSDLPGVSITFSTSACSWTLAEAAAGLKFGYQVVVEDDLPGVLPKPQDAGWCGQPGPSGLITFGRVNGNDQNYCICDTGLCQGPSEVPVTLKAGTYDGVFEWDGVNWGGPSDTGNPKGEAFPPGTYTLTISAKGTWEDPAAGVMPPFTVTGTFVVNLTP